MKSTKNASGAPVRGATIQLLIDLAHAGVLTVMFYLALQVVAFQLISSGI